MIWKTKTDFDPKQEKLEEEARYDRFEKRNNEPDVPNDIARDGEVE